MVKIEAIIRPEKVSLVVEALERVGCGGFHLLNVTGRGNQKGIEIFVGRGTSSATRSSLPKTLVVTVVQNRDKDKVIQALIEANRSGEEGLIGDGKIFISPVSEVVRVRTGEKNNKAL
jgi:nitrogen regulatory protein P-II 1